VPRFMADTLNISKNSSREEVYKQLHPQMEALLDDETDTTANLANFCAALKQTFGFFWIGFYLVKGNELVLGPFQGEVACTRIAFGKGVCGTAWKEKETVIVEDVNQFTGHIACSSKSLSEIVVPLVKSELVTAVLDVDSDKVSDFDEVDKNGLEKLVELLIPCFS